MFQWLVGCLPAVQSCEIMQGIKDLSKHCPLVFILGKTSRKSWKVCTLAAVCKILLYNCNSFFCKIVLSSFCFLQYKRARGECLIAGGMCLWTLYNSFKSALWFLIFIFFMPACQEPGWGPGRKWHTVKHLCCATFCGTDARACLYIPLPNRVHGSNYTHRRDTLWEMTWHLLYRNDHGIWKNENGFLFVLPSKVSFFPSRVSPLFLII